MAAGEKKDEVLAGLRHRAKARLEAEHALELEAQDRLIEELRVHQVELEMQSEELLRSQLALDASRNRYFELFDLAPVGYVTLDPTGKILEANRAASDLLDRDPAVLCDKWLSSFAAEKKDADLLHHHVWATFHSATRAVACDLVLKTRDGPRRVHLESTLLRSGHELRRTALSVIIDTTELDRAREELKSQVARTGVVLDTAVDAIVTCDEEGNVESLNRAAEVMFGRSAKDVVGRDVRILIPGFDVVVQEVASAGTEPSAREATAVRKDGTFLPVEITVGEWIAASKKMHTAIIRDVSARKEAERRLRESEARFRQIAENVEDVFYLQERDGRITYVSPAYEVRWGRSAADLTKTSHGWLEAVHPEDRAALRQARQMAALGVAPPDEVYRMLVPGGRVRWIRDRMFPVKDEEGEVLRIVGIARDVTEERELEEELRHAQKMEAVGTLASGIAHDFRNLLHGMIGCAVLAQRFGDDPERARIFMRKVEDAAKRGATLTDQLLSFTHKRVSRRAPMLLDPVVKESANLLERLLGEQIRPVMALSAPESVIRADRTEIEQILMNLAANARDAMPDGGTLTIRTEPAAPLEAEARRGAKGAGPHVRLVVTDTGSGMDEATKARIFEPFFTTKAVGKGTGLGLSTVFTTVRNLGGFMEVESAPGKGTTFVLTFPLSEEAPEPTEAAAAAIEAMKGTVLLVEDEPVVRMTLKSDLESIGLEVFDAEEPARALALWKDHGGFDVVVSDVMMPGMSGPKLMERLRSEKSDLPVVYVSAHPEEELLRRGLVDADVPVLQKPFSKEALAERLAEALADRR